MPYELGKVGEGMNRFGEAIHEEMLANESEEYVTGSTGCGLCALKALQEAGVTHLKLVGRGNHTAYMEEDIRQMKRALALVDEIADMEQYKHKIREELFSGKCSHNCYYR